MPDKKMETMLLWTPNQALLISPLVNRSYQQSYRQTRDAVFVSGRSCLRQRRNYAVYRATGLTRVSTLRTVRTGAARCGGCPDHSKSAHAKGRGDGDLAVRVCDVNSRPG